MKNTTVIISFLLLKALNMILYGTKNNAVWSVLEINYYCGTFF